jgi:hypothetical protein
MAPPRATFVLLLALLATPCASSAQGAFGGFADGLLRGMSVGSELRRQREESDLLRAQREQIDSQSAARANDLVRAQYRASYYQTAFFFVRSHPEYWESSRNERLLREVSVIAEQDARANHGRTPLELFQLAHERLSAVAQAVEATPLLAYWEKNDAAAYDRAVDFDEVLRKDPAWAGRPLTERFARAVELTLAMMPNAAQPPAAPSATTGRTSWEYIGREPDSRTATKP